jgi:hypothetical protein
MNKNLAVGWLQLSRASALWIEIFSDDTVYNTNIQCCVPMNDNMDSLNLFFQKGIPTYEIIAWGWC